LDLEKPHIAVQLPKSDQSTSSGASAILSVFSNTMDSVGPDAASPKCWALNSSPSAHRVAPITAWRMVVTLAAS